MMPVWPIVPLKGKSLVNSEDMYQWLYQFKDYGACSPGEAYARYYKHWLKGKIIDLGCGNGKTVYRIRKMSFDADGADQVRLDNDMIIADITQPMDIHRYTTSLCLDVFEHIDDRGVREILKNMSQTEKQVITVCNRKSVFRGPRNEELHINIKPFNQWKDLLSEYLVVDRIKSVNESTALFFCHSEICREISNEKERFADLTGCLCTEDVLSRLKGKSIAVVGNGRIAPDAGQTIDRHEIVIRINNYVLTENHENTAGRRTTLWCVNGWTDIKYRAHSLALSPFTEHSVESQQAKRFKYGRLLFSKKDWTSSLSIKRPSTGLMLLYILSQLGVECDAYGFDFFQNSGHYWDFFYAHDHHTHTESVKEKNISEELKGIHLVDAGGGSVIRKFCLYPVNIMNKLKRSLLK